MTIVWIRVIAGFLSGLLTGIVIMRAIYKKEGVPRSADSETGEVASASRAS